MGRIAEVNRYKTELGQYIRTARERLGMTQKELADKVGMQYYTAISAIEVGRNTVPPELYADFAEALVIPNSEFMREVLRLTDPWAYALLFSDDPRRDVDEINRRMAD